MCAVSVSLDSKSASVTYDPGAVDADALKDVVEACGFDVTAVNPDAVAKDANARGGTSSSAQIQETRRASPRNPKDEKLPPTSPLGEEPVSVSERVVTLAIGGMSCKRCSDWVARALTDVPGVQHVDVDLKTHVATVRGAATGAALVRKVSETGYAAKLVDVVERRTKAFGVEDTRGSANDVNDVNDANDDGVSSSVVSPRNVLLTAFAVNAAKATTRTTRRSLCSAATGPPVVRTTPTRSRRCMSPACRARRAWRRWRRRRARFLACARRR